MPLDYKTLGMLAGARRRTPTPPPPFPRPRTPSHLAFAVSCSAAARFERWRLAAGGARAAFARPLACAEPPPTAPSRPNACGWLDCLYVLSADSDALKVDWQDAVKKYFHSELTQAQEIERLYTTL